MRLFRLGLMAIALASRAVAQQPDAGAPSAPALASVALPPELDRVLREYERAWQSHDARALSELFAEDGFVLTGGRPPVRGRAAIRAAYSEAGGALSLRALAFATSGGVGYIIGGFGPAPGSADGGKFVLTLKRSGAARWLIMSDMDNSNRPWQPRPTEPVTPPPLPTPR
jgi:ketosteroid isomerase-like protein